MTADPGNFEKSLKELSLEGIILLQGLLAQRALQIIVEQKPKADTVKDRLLKPEKRILL